MDELPESCVGELADFAVKNRALPNERTETTSHWEDVNEMAHGQPGLDQRHRDKNGEIGKKHGNTLIRTLRKIYGAGFASGFKETDKLSDVLQTLDEASLSRLIKDHEAGTLGISIGLHS